MSTTLGGGGSQLAVACLTLAAVLLGGCTSASDRAPAADSEAATVAPTAVAASATASSTPPDPCGEVPVAPYLDVDGPLADAVDCARWFDVVRGTEPDLFAPSQPVRRDQMASLVARTVEAGGRELPAPDRDAFSDLEGNVHRDAIESLAAAGIVGGYPDGTFRPGQTVPRGQMTAFLVRAYEHASGAERGPAPDAFRDDDGHPHEPTIDQAAARGFASGRDADRFAPAELTTRVQTAAFLVRVLGALRGSTAPATSEYRATAGPLPASLRDRMTGVSWREGCPTGLDELRLIELVHRHPDGRDRWGLLVAREDTVDALTAAFGTAHAEGFPVERMQPVHRYDGDDDASMEANNTSAFNCRFVAGTSRWSNHAYGLAIDVNPKWNPYVRGDDVDPPSGEPWADRSDRRPGMLYADSALVTTLEARGWGWGGRWRNGQDYQHLSKPGS